MAQLDEQIHARGGKLIAPLLRLGGISPNGIPCAERGQAVVEFALVIPVLMLIVVGIFKFGTLYTNYTQLIDATRSSARQFAIERGQGDPCGDAVGRLAAAAGGLNTSNITAKLTLEGNANTYTYAGNAGSGTCPTLVSGSAATVSTSYPCDLNILGVNFFPGCTIKASATVRVE
jgi:Flp pilus assembly protein TadG